MHNMKHESYESIIDKLKEQRPKTRDYPVISIPICRGVRRIYSIHFFRSMMPLYRKVVRCLKVKKHISLYPCQFAEGIRHI